MKNILILNAGTRNTLVKYFKDTVNGRCKIIVTDSYYLAPALYEGDIYYVTSRWDAIDYWNEIYEICAKDNVGLVLSLVDPELEGLASQRSKMAELGILVNSAEEVVVKKSFDKFAMLDFLKNKGYPCIKTYIDYNILREDIDRKIIQYPLFAKPRYGSGSIGIKVIENSSQLKELFERRQNVIVQEYMQGQELGVDIFIDLLSYEVVSIFAKKKLKMRAGETDKSISCKNDRLFNMIQQFAKEYGLAGVNDIDVFEKDGKYFISEVNPRFGGGYLHAYNCGENYIEYLLNNMNGKTNTTNIGNYEENVYMMKYFDVKILRR